MNKSVHSEPYAVFLASLVETRKRRGVRQIELAQRLGKPQSFVSKYENGERRLDVVEFLEIMRALEEGADAIIAKTSAALGRSDI